MVSNSYSPILLHQPGVTVTATDSESDLQSRLLERLGAWDGTLNSLIRSSACTTHFVKGSAVILLQPNTWKEILVGFKIAMSFGPGSESGDFITLQMGEGAKAKSVTFILLQGNGDTLKTLHGFDFPTCDMTSSCRDTNEPFEEVRTRLHHHITKTAKAAWERQCTFTPTMLTHIVNGVPIISSDYVLHSLLEGRWLHLKQFVMQGTQNMPTFYSQVREHHEKASQGTTSRACYHDYSQLCIAVAESANDSDSEQAGWN